MNRNFVLIKYYKYDTHKELHKELHPKGVKNENNCIDKAMQELINEEIDYFKYEYNEHDIYKNQTVHVKHIIKKVGERYYETIQ